MTVFKTIKSRKTARYYTDKKVPRKILKKIINAGIWAGAIHGRQPWRFVVITQKTMISAINKIFVQKIKDIALPALIAFPTTRAISRAQAIICVYNCRNFSIFSKGFGEKFVNNARIAEISAIAAAVQNMILVSEELGVGSCWLSSPLFCAEEINTLLGEQDELFALLTIGYSDKNGKRSPRKPEEESVRFIGR